MHLADPARLQASAILPVLDEIRTRE